MDVSVTWMHVKSWLFSDKFWQQNTQYCTYKERK